MNMSETNSKNPLMDTPKKKKHLWGLWIPLIVIFSIVILPLGIVAILFYDPHHIDTGITEKKEEAAIFNSVMTDMFDGCRKENPTIDLKITQKQLNQLLYNASSNLPEQASKYLKQFSIQITDDSYVFDLEIGAFDVLKSHVTIKTIIQVDADLGNGDKGFLFAISDLKVGRLGNMQGLLPWAANTIGLDLSSIFSSAGLSIKADVDNLRLTYSYDDFVSDISSKAGSTDPLFLNIFSNFFKENYISFTHVADQHIIGSINMGDFLVNPQYTNSDYVINPKMGTNNDIPMLTYYSNIVTSLINASIIPDQNVEENARTTLKFLTYGKDYINSSEESFINTIYDNIKADYCSNLSIDDYSSARKTAVFGNDDTDVMKDITDAVNKRIEDTMSTPALKAEFVAKVMAEGSAYLFDENDPFIVSNEMIRDLLKSNENLIGYGFTFVGDDQNGDAKVSYAILDNVYPTIIAADPAVEGSKDMMALTFGLNINGAETSLILPMEGKEINDSNKHGLSFNMKDANLLFGTKTFPDLKNQLQEIINHVGSTEGDIIQFYKNPETQDIEEIRMMLDFDDYFNNNPDSEFTKFHKTYAEPNDAKLVIGFDFKQSEGDALGKRVGQFNIKVGYEKPTE